MEQDNFSPHGNALGLQFVSEQAGQLFIKVPYAAHLVGDPDTGVIHGGVITAALDNASGWCVRLHDQWIEGNSMATLDLRIDYMKPAQPFKDLLIMSECYKITRHIAFVRAVAYQDELDNQVASSVATFMLGTATVRQA